MKDPLRFAGYTETEQIILMFSEHLNQRMSKSYWKSRTKEKYLVGSELSSNIYFQKMASAVE